MSFGDPNNPYGQQPPAPQGQPGYGYPQQAPPSVPPQGGYAYPQQAPMGYPNQGYPAGPGGYPGAEMPMPGGVKAARVILFIVGGLQALGGIAVLLGGALFASAFSGSSSSEYGSSASDAGALAGGVIVVAGIFALALALWPILTAAKLGKGRGGVRVSGIIYGSLMTLFSGISLIINFVALSSDTAAGAVVFSLLLALIQFGLALWVLVGLANSAAGAYFRRPQY
ncbi:MULTISPECIES: hypothetical protein [unclassified Streptomyces]|uniref:Integral membrane protein n=1 Tax=Streptomyces sp. R33 TaxID=3238629 RepID=A0AB39Y3A7_9ACTN|nr:MULTISPECIES: hypothetical protein [unclassified Streptomyces]KJY47384.1 hypothetical protein VR46_03835 [Streptomyces sp. NRRL S-444]KOY57954.1 hypothetical protein ADK59_11335 [Streptomyces sp. XY332]TDU76448.1 hypothetical protein EDD91_3159 [Streptomyces sp. KS 21]THA35963.1 hypothetical protein E6W17_25880 [Streptomyces sp. A1547]